VEKCVDETSSQAERQQQAPAQPSLLTGYRQALFEALRRRDPRVANFYSGALVVIAGRGNPEAIFQAAHSIREMLEKAPLLVGAASAPSQRLNDKLAPLRAKFKKVKPNLNEDGSWQSGSENKIAKLLRDLRELCDWMDANLQQRKAQMRTLLRSLTGPGILLPSDVEEAELDELMELKEYFTNLAHHGFSATEEEFYNRLMQAETILLRKLNPEPSADFEAIDALLQEVSDAGK
jgi:hypothetical protein